MELIPDGYCRDDGCEEATNHLGYQSQCQKCPFERCPKEIMFGTRTLLRRKAQITLAFELKDKGLTDYRISYILKVPITTVKRWINTRPRIENKIQQYGEVCQIL